MSVTAGPYIPPSGLVLLLDVGNTKSYPGSGTTWTDLAQNLSFTSFGTTQTPVETMGKIKSFAFNGSGYWECTSGSSAVDLAGDFTLIMWLYEETQAVRRTVFEKAGNTYNSYQQELAITWETGTAWSYYSRYDAVAATPYDYGGTTTFTNLAWNMIAIKLSSGKSSTARTGFYSKNGAPWSASYTSNTSTAIVPAGNLRVGNGYAGVVGNGNIATLMVYNYMLSNTEINDLYNSYRYRFDI